MCEGEKVSVFVLMSLQLHDPLLLQISPLVTPSCIIRVCVYGGGAIFLYAECCNCGVRRFQPIRKRREWGFGKGGRSLRREWAGRRGRLKRMMCWGDFVRQAEEKIPAFC